ncbi:hypothetical protein F6X37_32345 [Paraburkholderia sp. 31.1]|uniref:NUMOD4 motif-containing HNH endonuclease n=1 Tax=Paraburkholderia sp. 31.1 TaxID=2615205 RepID=UPI001655E1F1|nr:NUMOD4 motif-containing HNH endonuclease [Paraburkholderia sp. 31.1]MBC8726059.1 hypothetical protein [Paraburkholderia sp. 31.1]
MQSTEPEIWKPVVGYEGYYEVSDQGRVRSLSRVVIRANGTRLTMHGRVLALPLTQRGYPSVVLSVDGAKYPRVVHQLVLEAFVGPRPAGAEGCHGDGDPTNNAASNLRWDSHSANMHDRVAHGNHPGTQKKRCPLGHLLQPFNLTATSMRKGMRTCLACSRARGMRSYRPEPFELLAHDRYAALLRGDRDGRRSAS